MTKHSPLSVPMLLLAALTLCLFACGEKKAETTTESKTTSEKAEPAKSAETEKKAEPAKKTEESATTDAAAAPKADDATAEANNIFSGRCAPCHGIEGKGDGAAAAGLNPKPANFTEPAWQKSVTDEHIEKIIREGGAAVGKSPLMPPNPDLVSKTHVVEALRARIRSLGPKVETKVKE